MGRYCLALGKRIAKRLPGVLLAMLVLLGGLMGAFTLMTRSQGLGENNQKFQVALVGTAGDSFVKMGLAALKTFDSSSLSMEIVEMEEAQARAALEQGKIGAYIQVPENFTDEAMAGRILPLNFVSTLGAAGLVSVFKEEVTQVISLLVLQSQRGVFGMQSAMQDAQLGGRGKHMDALAMEMVEYILVRDRTYRLTELGIAGSLGLGDYLLCGLWVLFLLLSCLPFAPLMIRRDLALDRMLAARGRPLVWQAVWEFVLYLGGILVLVLALGTVAQEVLHAFPLWAVLPPALLAAALSFFLYALCDDLIGGLLLQFFTTLGLCFVSGCMYPVHFFPQSVQRLAAFLPTGAARDVLAGAMTGSGNDRALVLTLAYSLLLWALGVAIRVRRAKEAAV